MCRFPEWPYDSIESDPMDALLVNPEDVDLDTFPPTPDPYDSDVETLAWPPELDDEHAVFPKTPDEFDCDAETVMYSPTAIQLRLEELLSLSDTTSDSDSETPSWRRRRLCWSIDVAYGDRVLSVAVEGHDSPNFVQRVVQQN